MLAGALTLVCVVPYIRDVLAGVTKPQRMSWLVFASLSIAAATAQFEADGWTSGVALTTGAAVGFGTVFVMSIKHGVGGGSRLDVASIAALVVALAIWSRTSNEHLVVGLIIAIEVPAVATTARKAWLEPTSETRSTWVIDAVAGLVAVVAAPSAKLALLAYPVFHTLANLSVVASIAHGTRVAPPAPGPLDQ